MINNALQKSIPLQEQCLARELYAGVHVLIHDSCPLGPYLEQNVIMSGSERPAASDHLKKFP